MKKIQPTLIAQAIGFQAARPDSDPLPIQYPGPFWRIKQVQQYTGLSRSTIYAYVKKGILPPPIQLGPRAVAWDASTLLKYLAEVKTASQSSIPEGDCHEC